MAAPPAVHRTVVVVDVEGFGDRRRTNAHQVAIRDGLYRALRQAFGQSWAVSTGRARRGWTTRPLLTGTLGGLVFGLAVGLAEVGASGTGAVLTAGLHPGLAAGLLIGLVARLSTGRTVPRHRWSTRSVLTGILGGLVFGLAIGLIPVFVHWLRFGAVDWAPITFPAGWRPVSPFTSPRRSRTVSRGA